MIPKTVVPGKGIHLDICRTDRFKAGFLSVSSVMPIDPGNVWMTTLLLSVLRRGTVRYPTIEALNRRLDYLYGAELSVRNHYRGDNQVIGLTAEIVDPSYLPADGTGVLDGVLDVMDQILFHPLLDENGLLTENYVESEKKLQCDAIRSQKNDPRSYAGNCLRKILYDTSPCGAPLLGTEEAVLSVTPRQLTEHWRSLCSSLRLNCFFVGSLSPEEVGEALFRHLGGELNHFTPGMVPYPLRTVPVRGTAVRAEETLPVAQGHLVIGLRTGILMGDRDYYACTVYNELLGVSPVSKLFVNVREKRSLCYSCSSVYISFKGAVLISCGLSPSRRAEAEEAIFEQVQAIAAGDFSDAELDAARKSLENSYRQLEDSPVALENYFSGRALAGQNCPIEECRAGFLSVTREDVIAVAKRVTTDSVFFLEGTLTGAGEEDDGDED